ncbi:MAG: CRISPR-associated protein Cas4 [Bryobacteraceae bacterium]
MDLIPVTDLKQWVYCGRIVYYHRVMPVIGKPTFKMREALAAQDLVEGLEMRRGLQAYGLAGARRRFGVWLSDTRLGLSGKTDLVLEADDRVAVVDFKLTGGEVGENHRMQLAGYSMLAEMAYGLPARVAFLYRIPDNRVFAVEITEDLRAAVIKTIDEIRDTAEKQWCPPATAVRGRCAECEYANYCADIW